MNSVTRNLQTLFDTGTLGALSNGQLLDRFLARRNEADFAVLVERLGPMVWGVCRRILRDHHDAEDAFQATFLVLARKADSIRPREKVGHWLHGVAYQTARKARANRLKRQTRERPSTDHPEPEATPDHPHNDLLDHLDRELSRLPEKYRLPILLCELEGQTHQQAASQLGWPLGTVSGRLSRARTLLAKRLTARGVPLSSGALAALLAQQAPASANMPIHLILSTAQAACLAAGRTLSASMVSAQVASLTSEVLNAMLLSKLKLAGMVLLALSLSGAGISVFLPDFGPSAIGQEPAESKASTSAKAPATTDQERLQGTWTITDIQQTSLTDLGRELMKSARFTITFKNNKMVYDIDGSFGYFVLDPSRRPKWMTFRETEGLDKDRFAPAIYKIEGDVLTICQERAVDPGPPSSFSIKSHRPTTFPTLMVLKRKSQAPEHLQDSEVPAEPPRAGLSGSTEVKTIIKTRVDTAREIVELQLKRLDRERTPGLFPDTPEWSLRWMESELQLSTTPAGKLAAAQAHVDRMRWLEKIVQPPDPPVLGNRWAPSEILKIKDFRLEAEQKLAELHAQYPDVPLPKPKELGKKTESHPNPPPLPPSPN